MSTQIWSFTAVGQDRPGIVAALCEVLYKHDCNISDSRMTILAGQFAVVLILEIGSETKTDDLNDALATLGKEWHLQVKAGPVETSLDDYESADSPPLLVSVYGADRTGITWKVAQSIAAHDYNVTDLSTRKIEGSTPVYILLLEIEAGPKAKSREALTEALGLIGQDLDCSITLKEVEISEL